MVVTSEFGVECEAPTKATRERYQSWRQLAGYFDGDGNVGLSVVKYVLRFRIRFSDTWEPQIQAIRSFLDKKRISTSRIWRETNERKRDAYKIDINSLSSVLSAAKAMLPFCAKKAEDLRIMVEYLEGRITGSQAIGRFNEEVRIGRRSGYFRNPKLPFTRQEGIRLAQLENARKARAAYAVKVGTSVQDQIRSDHSKLKLGRVRLSKKYGYSQSVIRRVLGAA